MRLKILNDDIESGVNTSVGSNVIVYGRTHPFSNLDEYTKFKKHRKDKKSAGKKASKKHRDTVSRRNYN